MPHWKESLRKCVRTLLSDIMTGLVLAWQAAQAVDMDIVPTAKAATSVHTLDMQLIRRIIMQTVYDNLEICTCAGVRSCSRKPTVADDTQIVL